MNPIIVLTDLRAEAIRMALSLASNLKEKKPILLASSSIRNNRDYGDSWDLARPLRYAAIKRMPNYVEVAATSSSSSQNSFEHTVGFVSSLYSETRDSKASPERYPRRSESLNRLCSGAQDLADFIIRKRPSNVCLFNGRLASSYAIALSCKQSEIPCTFYEFGPHKSTFIASPYPRFNMRRKDDDILTAFRTLEGKEDIELDRKSEIYRASKLNNIFTRSYRSRFTGWFDVTVFLSSSHEYGALDPTLSEIEPMSELDFVKSVVRHFGATKSIAVRCHPNQRQDPSWPVTLAPLLEWCSKHKVKVFDPDSTVSSYDLIERCETVAVDISSIGIDALLKGKHVEIFGCAPYKSVHDYLRAKYGKNKIEISHGIAKAMTIAKSLHQHPFMPSGNGVFLNCIYPLTWFSKNLNRVPRAFGKLAKRMQI